MALILPSTWAHGALILFCSLSFSLSGQIQQTVRGKVTDEFGQPLKGANVQLIGLDSVYSQATDEAGGFYFSVAPGRYSLTISFTGFGKVEEELLVIAGKISQPVIVLKQVSVQLKDVEVRASSVNAKYPGAYSISIEKTMRVPANFFDPVRMATSLPGVVATNDQSNSISIKGYSPNAMLWRLQGLDIVNPNHLANAGTLSDKPVANGGGVSILSSQVLDQTKFYSGSLPVQYGNALSGAMDMSLRPGNKIKRENTVQASLIGIDLATEGPLGNSKNEVRAGSSPLGLSRDTREGQGAEVEGSRSSYLINYRYSTVGLLSAAGINFGDEKINFQDLTFHLDFDQKKGKHLSVFGFGGLSSNQFDRKDTSEWKTEKDRYDINFTGKVYGAGFLSTIYSGEKSNLKIGAAISGQFQSRKSQSAYLDLTPALPNYIYSEAFDSERTLISGSINFTHRFSSSINFLAGMVATSVTHKLNVVTKTPLNFDEAFPNVAGAVDGILWQPFLSTSWKTRLMLVDIGVRYVHFGFNGSSSVEPRLNVTAPIFKGQLSLAYGITSQLQQTQTYLAPQNDRLDLTKAHQFTASFQKSMWRGFSFTLNAYHHKLFKVPVSAEVNPFSTINQMDDFVPGGLLSSGLGKNYGADILLEKKLVNQIYFIAGGSWYGSGYSNGSSTYLTSRYNGRFTSTFSSGKEWNRRNKTFGIHSRVLYLGGLRQQEISMADSQAYGDTRYIDKNVFPISLPDYFRLDLRLSWRKNKPGYTRTISLDIQNLTNQQNTAYYYYDTHLQKVQTKYQLGLIPVLVYRVDF